MNCVEIRRARPVDCRPFFKTPPIFKFNPFSSGSGNRKNYQNNALGRWELFIVQRKFTSEKNGKILFKLPGEWEGGEGGEGEQCGNFGGEGEAGDEELGPLNLC